MVLERSLPQDTSGVKAKPRTLRKLDGPASDAPRMEPQSIRFTNGRDYLHPISTE